ncbi:MAG: ATP synthase subunit I [Thermodesulfobacteriota bacterium]
MQNADLLLLATMPFLGFFLGICYFRGLWSTVRTLAGEKRFAGRMAASFLIRIFLLMVAFYLLMGHDWQRLIALTIGFWLARLLMIRRYGQIETQKFHGPAV